LALFYNLPAAAAATEDRAAKSNAIEQKSCRGSSCARNYLRNLLLLRSIRNYLRNLWLIRLIRNNVWPTPPLFLLDLSWARSTRVQLSTPLGCGHNTCPLLCIENICLTVTWVFCWVNFSRYGEKGNFVVDMGVAVWLADCWPNGIVHNREGLVAVGRGLIYLG
jgi:hypothetical protein